MSVQQKRTWGQDEQDTWGARKNEHICKTKDLEIFPLDEIDQSENLGALWEWE